MEGALAQAARPQPAVRREPLALAEKLARPQPAGLALAA
jgi:hypothetical protein